MTFSQPPSKGFLFLFPASMTTQAHIKYFVYSDDKRLTGNVGDFFDFFFQKLNAYRISYVLFHFLCPEYLTDFSLVKGKALILLLRCKTTEVINV